MIDLKRKLILIIFCIFTMLFYLSGTSFAGSKNLSAVEHSFSESVRDDGSYEKPKPEPPEVKNGWIEEAGNTYYYIDGFAVKNQAKKIGEATYYFDYTGRLVKSKGWFKCSDGYRRYGLGNGEVATGPKRIEGILYFFNESGLLKEKGFFTFNGHGLYSKGGGKLATEWTVIGKYAYYFHGKTGYMAKATKVWNLKIPKRGRLDNAYALGIKKLNKHSWSLRKAYEYSYKLKYANRKMRKKSSESYAVYGFQNGCGNCYVMAATFYIQAKLLGYNVRQIEGKVDLAHSWTQIKHGKKWYVYDPNFKNETGRNGWKFKYGKRGTWRYNSYRVFQS